MTATLNTVSLTKDFFIAVESITITDPIDADRANVSFGLNVRYFDELPEANFHRGITVNYVYTNEIEQIVTNLQKMTLATDNSRLLKLLQDSESKLKVSSNYKASMFYTGDTVQCLKLDNPPVFTIPIDTNDLQTETQFREALTIAFLPFIQPWSN